ncbi:MAG: ATP synthase F0 subunit B [Polyangiales bacterium]
MKRSIVAASLALALAAPAAWAQEHGENNGQEQVQEHGASHEGFHAPAVPFNLANPSPPPAQEGGREVKAPPPFLFGPVLNFAVLVVLGYMAVRRVVNPGLAARRAAVETEIAEAKRLHDEAAAIHKEYTTRLDGLEGEIAALKADLVKQGEAERDRIVAEAHARAERMRAEGTQAIEQEMRALRDELRREAVVAAVTAAEEAVRKNVTAADQVRLVDDFVAAIEAEAKAQPAKGARA